MILVSQTSIVDGVRAWPDSIVSFIPKSAGYGHVLEQAAKFAGRRPPDPCPPVAAALAAAG